MKRFSDRHVVVTGAGSGIGRAIAERLCAEGARVSLMGRRFESLQETSARCWQSGGIASVILCDVRDPASVETAFEQSFRAHGPLFACVANAGMGGPNSAGPDDRYFELVQTNLVGSYLTLRAAEKRLEEGSHARHLVALSSILGRFGVPGYTGYCASKAGVLGLVRALALELAPRNVQVNALCPGWVETEMAWSGIDGMAAGMGVDREEALRVAMQAVPLGRMGKPEDIAGVVAFLLSEDARGITGQGIDVNGGAWMG